MPNRLQFAKSPYLLQHANNPVNWLEWGADAFSVAKREKKLVFLSIGYSACHWCHVMAHECFESPEIADVLNSNFVSIKVDREERPDVDAIYMHFVMSISGHGGWPLTAFLTPDGEPIYGGTYFPPSGFLKLLNKLITLWRKDRQRCIESAASISEQLREIGRGGARSAFVAGVDVVTRAMQQLRRDHDEDHAGFGSAPKFPSVANTHHLLHRLIASASTSSTPLKQIDVEDAAVMLQQSVKTLQRIGRGGIADHLGGGISRYSVDEEWRVPHFEKMLYDQAQLLSAYSEAIMLLRHGPKPLLSRVETLLSDSLHRVITELERVAVGIVRYLATDLSDEGGAFFSAEDADSLPSADDKKTKEGAFYVWEQSEIERIIVQESSADEGLSEGAYNGEQAFRLLRAHYGLRPSGNIPPSSDPHGELVGQNVLHSAVPLHITATALAIPIARAEDLFGTACARLLRMRNKRPRPHLDDKIVSGWNFLAVSGLCRASQALPAPHNEEALTLARRATAFVFDKIWDAECRTLHRSYRRGLGPQGVAADYAYAISALLDLYETTLDTSHLSRAHDLQIRMDELFWDHEANGSGGYFTSSSSIRSDDGPVLARLKDEHDEAEPAANSVAADNLRRLLHYFALDRAQERKQRLESLLSSTLLQRHPRAVGTLAACVLAHASGGVDIVIVGSRASDVVQACLGRVQRRFIPNRSLILVDSTDDATLTALRDGPLGKNEVVEGLLKDTKVGDVAKVYICRGFQCGLPLSSVEELEQALHNL